MIRYEIASKGRGYYLKKELLKNYIHVPFGTIFLCEMCEIRYVIIRTILNNFCCSYYEKKGNQIRSKRKPLCVRQTGF